MDDFKSYLHPAILVLMVGFVTFSSSSGQAGLRATGAVGFLAPLRLGVEMSLGDQWDGVLEAGYGPYPKIGTLDLSSSAIESRAHFYPGWGPLYFGGGLGYQIFHIGTSIDLAQLLPMPGHSNASFTFQIFYLSLGLGGRWNLSEPLTIGFDLGCQIPLLSTGSLAVPNRTIESQQLADSASKALGYLSNLLLPRVNLIKIGYEF